MKHLLRVSGVYDLPYIGESSTTVSEHVDLRRFPKQVSKIPELQQARTLRTLVEVLNAKNGIFMTHACAFAHRKPEGRGVIFPMAEASATASHWCTGYVTFSFWRFAQNTEREYEALYEKCFSEESGAEIWFTIQPAYFLSQYEVRIDRKWGERNAFVCLLWVSGCGDSADIAHSHWRKATRSLIQFFESLRGRNGENESSGMSVSDQFQSMDPNPPAWVG
jgi:hypothetical protein